MTWILIGIYFIGLVIAYMVAMLITHKKPSEWDGTGVYDDMFNLHLACFLWPFSLSIIMPFFILYCIVVGITKIMDRFYDFVKGDTP